MCGYLDRYEELNQTTYLLKHNFLLKNQAQVQSFFQYFQNVLLFSMIFLIKWECTFFSDLQENVYKASATIPHNELQEEWLQITFS